ncbi:MAG: hypothetical protein LBO09_04135 [Candidatus Peribacteria bacterium]|jgi:hypothetical protein|nr:hypothetical protein [Candidatus Peribacteria bacterium]
MEYGKMITLWYNGEEQESKYYKYRDGFNSSKDNKVNNFSTVHDILVDDTV